MRCHALETTVAILVILHAEVTGNEVTARPAFMDENMCVSL
jgi:hypothetical protein